MKYASIAYLTLAAVVPVFALPSPSGPLPSGGGDDIESHPAVSAGEPLENDLEPLANSTSHPAEIERDFKQGAIMGLMAGAEIMPLLESEGPNLLDALQNLLPSGSQTEGTSSGGSPFGLNLRTVPPDPSQPDEEQTELLAEGDGRALLGAE